MSSAVETSQEVTQNRAVQHQEQNIQQQQQQPSNAGYNSLEGLPTSSTHQDVGATFTPAKNDASNQDVIGANAAATADRQKAEQLTRELTQIFTAIIPMLVQALQVQSQSAAQPGATGNGAQAITNSAANPSPYVAATGSVGNTSAQNNDGGSGSGGAGDTNTFGTPSNSRYRRSGTQGSAFGRGANGFGAAASGSDAAGTSNLRSGETVSNSKSLAANKRAVVGDLNGLGASKTEQAWVMAILMQETNNLRPGERDHSKGGAAANYSIANMSGDMLRKLGYKGDLHALNDPKNLKTALSYLVKGLRSWGPKKFLDFQRGGITAFKDGHSYDAAGYRNAVAASQAKIARNLQLLTNHQRVAKNVHGV